jgi:hypothetical protein
MCCVCLLVCKTHQLLFDQIRIAELAGGIQAVVSALKTQSVAALKVVEKICSLQSNTVRLLI